jgi:hypothetical protein
LFTFTVFFRENKRPKYFAGKYDKGEEKKRENVKGILKDKRKWKKAKFMHRGENDNKTSA